MGWGVVGGGGLGLCIYLIMVCGNRFNLGDLGH